jgi:RNA polymerase sporulation-specific sigma factor
MWGVARTLPPPMSKEEEADCILRLAAASRGGKQLLIVHNLRLVVYIAKRFENTGIILRFWFPSGANRLIKSINTYDYKKNIKLATYYLSRCIENEILMYLRKDLRTEDRGFAG